MHTWFLSEVLIAVSMKLDIILANKKTLAYIE